MDFSNHLPTICSTSSIHVDAPMCTLAVLFLYILDYLSPIQHMALTTLSSRAFSSALPEHHTPLYETFQSGCRTSHNNETALVRVLDDLLMAADSGSPSLSVTSDQRTAFDTVDYTILHHKNCPQLLLSLPVLKAGTTCPGDIHPLTKTLRRVQTSCKW